MPTYTGVVLDAPSRTRLWEPFQWTFAEMMAPVGFRGHTEQGVPLPHHMTMNLGACKDPELIGKTVELTVDAWAVDQRVFAVRVSDHDGVYCDSKVPHITIFVNPPGKPRHSNELTNWVSLPNPIKVTGTVREV